MSTDDKECIICTEKLDIGRKLPCGHCFHLICLTKWIEKGTKKCPLCRNEIKLDMELKLFSNRNIIKDFSQWLEGLILGVFGIRVLSITIEINHSQNSSDDVI